MEDNKHPLEWFEARVGSFIFRAPYFKDEVDRGQPVTIKVSTKDHALKLFTLQRNDRPTYVDNREKVTLDNGTISSASGKDKKLYWRYQRFLFDKQCDNVDNHWMCGCGHYEESGLHCSMCGAEPPWGCDCSFCNERAWRDEDEDVQFISGDYYGMADGL